MESLNLSINGKVEVLWDEKSIYKSIIQEVEEDGFSITVPLNNGEYLTPHVGEKLELMCYDDSGNVYKFNCKVKGRNTDNNIPLYILSEPYDVSIIQRRNYVRVKIVQMIQYLKGSLEGENIDRLKFSPAILLDLSGGGMRIKVNEKPSLGEKLLGELKYNGDEALIKAKIVRVEKTEDNKYICGVSFDDLDNITREKIIKMVFTIMRKQRELL